VRWPNTQHAGAEPCPKGSLAAAEPIEEQVNGAHGAGGVARIPFALGFAAMCAV
jgi:hypothetical protein